MKLRIVHITDIHLSKNNLNSFRTFYLKALIDDLIQLNNERRIDIICLTGDLLDKGGSSFKLDESKYLYFLDEFWVPIADALGMKNEQLFIVPGNHDIDENLIDKFVETGVYSSLKTIESVNEFMSDYKQAMYSVLDRQLEYKEFERLFYPKNEDRYVSNFETCHVINLDGNRIGIACLNTSWRCYTKQKDDGLVMGSEQITNAASFFREKKCNFVIGLMHHPIDFISSIEREEVLNKLMNSGYDLLLFGHTHHGVTQYRVGNNGNLCISTARTGFSNPRESQDKYKSGYTIIDVNNLDVTFNYRKYVNDRVKFAKDGDIADDGEFKTTLLPKNGKEKFHQLMLISDEVYKSKIDDMNESLVIHGTSTVAPRSVNEIFVLPRLTDNPVSYGSFENEKQYNIQEIISYSGNVLIAGDKESGKSTLLNKIFSEVSNNFSIYEKLPIVIDFHAIHNKSIKSLIKSFLGTVSSSGVDELIKNSTLLLLIDNANISSEHSRINQRLQEFLLAWPTIKVIAATTADVEDFIEEESIELSKFKKIYIGSVGAREFKSLASKWFSGRDDYWVKSNLATLISIFEKLKISRTFFSVSLFLWIIEKNMSFKPTNNNDLIFTFLTYILEGFNFDNAAAGSYNFTKKTELLTELSFAMYDSGDKENNYVLREDKVIGVVQNNFAANQLSLTASEKVNEFVDRGLLRRNKIDNTLQFRFESFFQFFLSRVIDLDISFKNNVIKSENFLNFIEELDFYSGYKRNDKALLIFAAEGLEKDFSELGDEFVKSNVDEFFPDDSFLFKNINASTAFERAKGMKLSDNDIEEVMDKQMDLLPINSSISIKKSIPNRLIFSRSLEMTARILKNSENIKDPFLVNKVLDSIISKSAVHSVYIQSLIVSKLSELVENSEEDLPVDIPMEVMMFIGPMMSQEMLAKWGGTEFLEVPLSRKIHKYLDDRSGNLSEIELFISVFLYCDIKGPGYPEMLNAAIDKMNNKFVLELSYLKVLTYYMMKSSRSPLLKTYENAMVNIMVKVKGLSKAVARTIITEGTKSYRENLGKSLPSTD